MSAISHPHCLVPLFIPLYTRYFEAFKRGSKKTEFRTYGPGWNERTCVAGRRVTISKGYGKYERLSGVITRFNRRKTTACIRIELDAVQQTPNTFQLRQQ